MAQVSLNQATTPTMETYQSGKLKVNNFNFTDFKTPIVDIPTSSLLITTSTRSQSVTPLIVSKTVQIPLITSVFPSSYGYAITPYKSTSTKFISTVTVGMYSTLIVLPAVNNISFNGKPDKRSNIKTATTTTVVNYLGILASNLVYSKNFNINSFKNTTTNFLNTLSSFISVLDFLKNKPVYNKNFNIKSFKSTATNFLDALTSTKDLSFNVFQKTITSSITHESNVNPTLVRFVISTGTTSTQDITAYQYWT